jgi:MoxR-like ATPase
MSELREVATVQARARELSSRIRLLREELGRAVLGQDDLISDLVVALLAGGHVLLEGLPGLGKTLLVKSLSHCLGLSFARVQFTPDLMPADITGTRMIETKGTERQFRFQKGPVFANLVLADEINRATPKTQSALLEAMQEGSVTVANETHPLPEPFAVVATQNPIELEGTYPLPEAQLDRFLFKLLVPPPGVGDLVRILDGTTGVSQPELRVILAGAELLEFRRLSRQVICGEHLLHLVAELIQATHPSSATADERTKRLIRFGASPRAAQAMVLSAKVRALLDDRAHVAREDLQASLRPALRHRIVLSFDAQAEGLIVEDLIDGWYAAAERRAIRP